MGVLRPIKMSVKFLDCIFPTPAVDDIPGLAMTSEQGDIVQIGGQAVDLLRRIFLNDVLNHPHRDTGDLNPNRFRASHWIAQIGFPFGLPIPHFEEGRQG